MVSLIISKEGCVGIRLDVIIMLVLVSILPSLLGSLVTFCCKKSLLWVNLLMSCDVDISEKRQKKMMAPAAQLMKIVDFPICAVTPL